MEYIKIRFGDDFRKRDTEFQGTLDAMFNLVSPAHKRRQNTWRPQLDVYETPEGVLVVVELAGVKEEDIRVEVAHRTIKIYGIRRPGMFGPDIRYRVAEIPYGYFERSLSLPWTVDRDQVTATYADGILQIGLSKVTVEMVHRISVRRR